MSFAPFAPFVARLAPFSAVVIFYQDGVDFRYRFFLPNATVTVAANMTCPESTTDLVYQRDAKLHHLRTVVEAVLSFDALEPASQALFKQGTSADHAVVTRQTIFHPQGGGQPSDEGTMTAGDVGGLPLGSDSDSGSGSGSVFQVVLARQDVVDSRRVLHFGRFAEPSRPFVAGQSVDLAIDADKRLLYSRLHTAGHVLGAAVRRLLETEVPGFDELKASHFPDSAACEFRGRIEGRWLAPIQTRVDEYIAQAMPVEIEWWDAEDFRRNGLERLLPERPPSGAQPDEKLRVVRIVGAEVYPCGGTHVDTTDLCGATKVTKISRAKGNSRVSYALV